MPSFAMPAPGPTPRLPDDVRLMHAGVRALLGLLALVLLALALLWLGRRPWFDLRVIRVEGEVTHNSADSLRVHALPQLHGNYFSINLREARAVFEAVPWVRRAQVSRVWPNQLAVQIVEHHPVALWEREELDDLLVDREGEVFEVNLGELDTDSLPLLRGPQGSAPRVWAMWQRLAPEFTPLGTTLQRLALSDGGSWRATLNAGDAVVEIGRGEADELLPRVRRFVHSVAEVRSHFENRPIESADLRHSEGYALRLVGMGTLEPGQKKKR
ncbi:MAG: cell division protein FtsQ/DivIB [Leptothrix sp. (in: b-proteobacteria)]